MRRSFKIIVCLVSALLVCGALAIYLAYRATQQVPDFYLDHSSRPDAGDELEKQLLDLHNAMRRDGKWNATFSDEQINGWLAADLPKKFPSALPSVASNPRVSISPELAQIACRYKNRRFSTVMSVAVTVQTTEEPNEVAVSIRKTRAGTLPLPFIERWKEAISAAARRTGISVHWADSDGKALSLVKIPMQFKEFKKRELRLDTIQLRDGEVYIEGHTTRIESSSKP